MVWTQSETGVPADRIEHYEILKLSHHFSHDVNALVFELLKMG